RFLNILREVGTQNTVIFSTHIVDDVKELCNEMAIMNGGRILQQATPETATANINGQVWTSDVSRDDLEQIEQTYKVISSSYNRDNSINIRVHAASQPNQQFIQASPNLEDVYFIALQGDA
ncbi:MAG: ABC transporter ATP-binding protein, partial [Bacteroidota bacterium]